MLVISILASNFRHLRYPQSKIVCLLLLARIGCRCSDDVITQRIIPLTLCGLEVSKIHVKANLNRSFFVYK